MMMMMMMMMMIQWHGVMLAPSSFEGILSDWRNNIVESMKEEEEVPSMMMETTSSIAA